MSTQKQVGQRSPKPKRIVDSDSKVALDTEITNSILDKYDEVEDCFTKEWDPKTQECSVCSAEQICGIMFAARTKRKVKKFEAEEEASPLDLADFSKVPSTKLVTKAKEFEEVGEYMTVEELFEFVSTVSKCDDEGAVIEWIKRWVKDNPEIYTKEGQLRYRLESND